MTKSSTNKDEMKNLIKVIQDKSGKEIKENYQDTSETILAKNQLKNVIKISELILGRTPKICYKLDNITAVDKSIPGNIDARKINRMMNDILFETFKAKSDKIYDLAALMLEYNSNKAEFKVIEWDDKNVPVTIKIAANVSKIMEKLYQASDPEIKELGNKYANLKDKTDVLSLKEFGEWMYIMSVGMSKGQPITDPSVYPPCDN